MAGVAANYWGIAMTAFRVGDVCVGVGFVFRPEFNGMECIVSSGLFWKESRQCFLTGNVYPGAFVHNVEWANGESGDVRPVKLRLRRPPSWDKWIYQTDAVDSEQRVSA